MGMSWGWALFWKVPRDWSPEQGIFRLQILNTNPRTTDYFIFKIAVDRFGIKSPDYLVFVFKSFQCSKKATISFRLDLSEIDFRCTILHHFMVLSFLHTFISKTLEFIEDSEVIFQHFYGFLFEVAAQISCWLHLPLGPTCDPLSKAIDPTQITRPGEFQ
jgi:hypothetical protein